MFPTNLQSFTSIQVISLFCSSFKMSTNSYQAGAYWFSYLIVNLFCLLHFDYVTNLAVN